MLINSYKVMKKRFLLVLAAVFASVALHAQFVIGDWHSGEVYFNDGRHEEFAELRMPRCGDKNLSVKKNQDDKKQTKISVEDIFAIKVWAEKFPEKVYTLYYLKCDKKFGLTNWGSPVVASDWGVIYESESNYTISDKDGTLGTTKYYNRYNILENPTLYFLKRPNEDKAVPIIAQSAFKRDKLEWSKVNFKNYAAQFFKENEEIYEGIKSGKLQPTDIQYILDEMAGGKKAEEPAKAAPETKTDSVSNGVVGDDE